MRVELNWYQRISLWLRVGAVQAPNMRTASTLYRVIEKIRPNDEEREQANLITKPSGYEWRLPSFDYGTRTVDLEIEEAEALAAVLENPQSEMPVLVADMGWIMPLVEQLKAKPKEEAAGELVAAR